MFRVYVSPNEMGWSRTAATYPPQVQELFIGVLKTGKGVRTQFDTAKDAAYFERMIQALRYAYLHDKAVLEEYRIEAANYTTERSEDGLSVTICPTSETRKARLATMALRKQEEQYREAGIDFNIGELLTREPAND